jgi:hypothetical protein
MGDPDSMQPPLYSKRQIFAFPRHDCVWGNEDAAQSFLTSTLSAGQWTASCSGCFNPCQKRSIIIWSFEQVAVCASQPVWKFWRHNYYYPHVYYIPFMFLSYFSSPTNVLQFSSIPPPTPPPPSLFFIPHLYSIPGLICHT